MIIKIVIKLLGCVEYAKVTNFAEPIQRCHVVLLFINYY